MTKLSEGSENLIFKGKTFLIVDDERHLLDIYEAEMKRLGAYVYVAENSQQAFTFLKEIQIDLLISDVVMPGGSGLELLKGIEDLKKKNRFPIIMISGHQEIDLEEFKCRGACCVLYKPFTTAEIAESIYRVLFSSDVENSPLI